MGDILYWLLIPLLLVLVGVYLYMRNKRPDDDD